jgi:hypothetical protein
MKAILEFNLPEEDYNFKLATQSIDIYGVLTDMDKWLRNTIKYAPINSDAIKLKTLQDVRNKLREFASESDILLD